MFNLAYEIALGIAAASFFGLHKWPKKIERKARPFKIDKILKGNAQLIFFVLKFLISMY